MKVTDHETIVAPLSTFFSMTLPIVSIIPLKGILIVVKFWASITLHRYRKPVITHVL